MTSPARAPQILFATDFSETAAEALRVAAEYAQRLGGRLHVLHVVVPGADWLAEPRAEQLTRGIEPAVAVVATVAYGLPASAIVRYAEEHAIDLIVVGTHGRTGISRALTGSVAERVVRSAPCPVLTVPRCWRPGGQPTPRRSRFRRIVASCARILPRTSSARVAGRASAGKRWRGSRRKSALAGHDVPPRARAGGDAPRRRARAHPADPSR